MLIDMPEEYSSPIVTIWKAESLDKIEAELSYGCSNTCSNTCSNSPSSENATWRSAFELQINFLTRRRQPIVYYKFYGEGATKVFCDAPGASIVLQGSGNNDVPTTTTYKVKSDRMSEIYWLSPSGLYYLSVTSKDGSPVSSSTRYCAHVDIHDADYDVGATWKPTGLPSSSRVVHPIEVVYYPGDRVRTVESLIHNDIGLQLLQFVFDGVQYTAGEIAAAAAAVSLPVAAVALAVNGLAQLLYPETASVIVDKIRNNGDAYQRGIRAYHYIYSLVVKWDVEPWDGVSPMRGPAGSVGEFTRNNEE